MPLWLLVVLMGLATFRLTRLIVKDTFPPIQWVRTKIQHARPFVTYTRDVHVEGKIRQGKIEEYWWLGELVGCGWCASAYVSGGITIVVWLMIGLPLPVLVWLAVWGIGALITSAS